MVPTTGYFLAILSAQSCNTVKSCSFNLLTSGSSRCSGANDICVPPPPKKKSHNDKIANKRKANNKETRRKREMRAVLACEQQALAFAVDPTVASSSADYTARRESACFTRILTHACPSRFVL